MPQAVGCSRPWRDHRQVVEGIVFRYRTGVAWRDLPGRFGPWQTVWKRHHRFATDGTPMMLPLLAHLRVQRTIGGPRTRPGRCWPEGIT